MMISRLLLFGTIVAWTHGSPCKRVVCYYTNWAQYRPEPQKFVPEDVDATKCTHINYAFAKLEQNNLAPFEWNDDSTAWSKGMYERLHEHAKKQNPDVKILLSVGGWNMGSDTFTKMVATPENRKEFATNSVEFLRKRKFDGLDLDWEYPARRGSPPEDKENFVELLKILLQVYEKEHDDTGNPQLLLTAAVAAGKSNIDAAYDVPRISKYLDFINVMTYDLHGSWDKTTGHNSPLYARSGETGEERYLNVDWAVRYWVEQGAPKNKLVIGLPTYGRTFTLTSAADSGVGAPASGPGRAGQYTREAGFLSYYEICDLIKAGASVRYIEDQKVPYLVSNDQWVGYDDQDSLREKVKYMRDHGYGGVMVWSFDLDDFSNSCGKGKYPLLSTIAGECMGTSSSTPRPASTESPNSTEGTTPRPTTTTTTSASTTTTTKTPSGGDFGKGFSCPNKEIAIFPSLRNCRDFYTCVNGDALLQSCHEPMVFNPNINTCDWPRNYQCKIIESTLSPPAATEKTTTVETSTSTSSPSTTTTVTTTSSTTSTTIIVSSTPSATSAATSAATSVPTSSQTTPTTTATAASTTASETTTTSDLSNFCENKPNGLYKYPTDCSKYILCDNGQTHIRPCAPGTVFNPENGVCDFPQNVPGCQLV